MQAIYENKELLGLSAVSVRGLWAFPEMFHPHCEIVMIRKGEASIRINGEKYLLKAGELCFVFPYTVHSYEEAPEAEGDILLFDSIRAGCFEGFLNSHTPKIPVVAAPQLSPLTQRICTLCKHKDSLSLQTAGAYLQALTGELLTLMDFTSPKDPIKDVARQALSYCAEHYCEEDLSLSKIAAALFVSPGYLSKVFRRKLSLSFPHYLNHLRLSKAKLLLIQTKKPVVEIMLDCGFSNQSTFNRLFLAQYQLTPREYRKRFSPITQG